MENELTKGPVMQTMLRFAVPMILGDLLQQCYNLTFTLSEIKSSAFPIIKGSAGLFFCYALSP